MPFELGVEPAGGESRDFLPLGPGEPLCSSRTRFNGPTGVGVRFDCYESSGYVKVRRLIRGINMVQV